MSAVAWTFLVGAWSFVLALNVYCLVRNLKGPGPGA